MTSTVPIAASAFEALLCQTLSEDVEPSMRRLRVSWLDSEGQIGGRWSEPSPQVRPTDCNSQTQTLAPAVGRRQAALETRLALAQTLATALMLASGTIAFHCDWTGELHLVVDPE